MIGKVDRREWLAAALPALALALFAALAAAVVALTLEGDERRTWLAALESRAALVVMLWLVAALALGALSRTAYARWVAAAARLAEQAAAIAAGDVPRTAPIEGASAETLALQRAIDGLAAQRAALREDFAARVRAASRDVELERGRLAALMAELTQSVVVCNLDGRILLYNNRARLQFRALSDAVAAGSELLGIGRSIYAVFDRKLVAHALQAVQQRLQRGVPHPSTQFVTAARGGQLLRVQMAPVRGLEGGTSTAGFVLMLDDITRDFTAESERDRALHLVTEGMRASLGNLRAAVELLDEPGLDAATGERFRQVVRDEAAALSERVQLLAVRATEGAKARWPLEPMLGADFVDAARQRIEAVLGMRAAAADVDGTLWLHLDSYSLLQAVLGIAGRLHEEYDVKLVHLRLQRHGTRAQLDIVWAGRAMSTETVVGWETEPIRIGAEAIGLSVRDVIERHGGAFWFERERVRHECFFRLLLPLAEETAPLAPAPAVGIDERPEFYDFDLFAARDVDAELGARRLAELAYTVFDTETTGLDPGRGDEIIQLGATRIVAGKLRRQECFEQLVDPQRSVPETGIAIHGLRPEALAGKPRIDAVLRAFHAFAADTVLVAHNAAFDMRFLQLAEPRSGVRFEQPVLDTLLLSAALHPNQASHRLEDIATRLGVAVVGRHSALGDALITAEVFLKLIPLLAADGIETLAQAREAAQKTYLARLEY